ncbi:uncharacterized protein AB675_7310 [Cyphellophora attinorum]|uniref:Uncharacterized protein n=1 Tax=Cyphellophora attinorum TaxID=1664694 RepID=A0A0N1GZA3_9EURO|nr:uncharacterized protein AB675_7310 [Phialophora attinorum]KPI36313.1 hypothetical protein AB675_7310 [Phialophora attinorum]
MPLSSSTKRRITTMCSSLFAQLRLTASNEQRSEARSTSSASEPSRKDPLTLTSIPSEIRQTIFEEAYGGKRIQWHIQACGISHTYSVITQMLISKQYFAEARAALLRTAKANIWNCVLCSRYIQDPVLEDFRQLRLLFLDSTYGFKGNAMTVTRVLCGLPSLQRVELALVERLLLNNVFWSCFTHRSDMTEAHQAASLTENAGCHVSAKFEQLLRDFCRFPARRRVARGGRVPPELFGVLQAWLCQRRSFQVVLHTGIDGSVRDLAQVKLFERNNYTAELNISTRVVAITEDDGTEAKLVEGADIVLKQSVLEDVFDECLPWGGICG